MADLFSEAITAQRANFLLRLINIAGCTDEQEAALAFEWLEELMAEHTNRLIMKQMKTPCAGDLS